MPIKKIEHRYATSLEQVKTELEARYSTLKTSVDFLSASQSDLRPKIIASTEALWAAVIEIEQEFGDLVFIENIILREELQKFFDSGDNGIRKIIGHYSDANIFEKKMKIYRDLTSEKNRLFSGERLWLVFYTLARAHGRMCWLMHQSFNKREYLDWQTDSAMDSILRSVLTDKVLDKAKEIQLGGFGRAVIHLKAEFLKEAARVMSGSEHVAESLANMQSTLLYEKQRLDDLTERRERSNDG